MTHSDHWQLRPLATLCAPRTNQPLLCGKIKRFAPRQSFACLGAESEPKDLHEETCCSHRHHRPGRRLPGRTAARQGLRRLRHLPPHQFGQLLAHRGTGHSGQPEPAPGRVRPDRPRQLSIRLLQKAAAATRSTTWRRKASSACRSSSPTTTAQITGIGRAATCSKRSASSIRRSASTRPRTSEMFGKVQADSAGRRHALLSAQPVRRGQALRALDDGQLPRELRHLRQQRHPVQPRKSRCAAASSSPARSPTASPRSSSASSTCWNWATWTPSATGAMPRNTSKACGGCCRPTSPTPSCWPPTAPRPCATSCAWPSRPPASSSTSKASERERSRHRHRRPARRWCASTRKFYRPAEVDLLIGDPAQGQGEARLGADDDAGSSCAR